MVDGACSSGHQDVNVGWLEDQRAKILAINQSTPEGRARLAALTAKYGGPNPLPACPPGSKICAALATREETDRAGRTLVTYAVPSLAGWKSATVCTRNCGAGTGFFGLGGGAAEIGRTVGGIIAKIAPALTPAGAFITIGEQLATQVERSQQGMSLNISGILGAVGSAIGGANFGDYSALGQIASSGFNIASALTQTAPTYATPVYQPQVYGPIAPVQPMQATPTMATAPAFSAAAGRIAAMTAPILAKIAVKIGLRARPSLTRAMDLIRKGAKLLSSPEAVAAALGITVAEMATLITASNSRKRRSMNPANAKALRRAARRIKSFHRLCTHTDLLKSRARRGSSGCFKCGKRKCSC